MRFFRKKEIIVVARWNDRRGKEKTIRKTVTKTRKAHIIVMWVNDVEIRVRVES